MSAPAQARLFGRPRLVRLHTVEMQDNLVDVHDINVLVMEVEKIDLVTEFRAVVGAFFDK